MRINKDSGEGQGEKQVGSCKLYSTFFNNETSRVAQIDEVNFSVLKEKTFKKVINGIANEGDNLYGIDFNSVFQLFLDTGNVSIKAMKGIDGGDIKDGKFFISKGSDIS